MEDDELGFIEVPALDKNTSNNYQNYFYITAYTDCAGHRMTHCRNCIVLKHGKIRHKTEDSSNTAANQAVKGGLDHRLNDLLIVKLAVATQVFDGRIA